MVQRNGGDVDAWDGCDVAAPALHCITHEAMDGEGKAVSSKRASKSMSLEICAAQSYTSYTTIQYHLVPLHQGLIPLEWER